MTGVAGGADDLPLLPAEVAGWGRPDIAVLHAYALQAIESDRARRQGALTDEEIVAIAYREVASAHRVYDPDWIDFARAIIAALSIPSAR